MRTVETFLVVASLPVIVTDAGVAISYSPGQTFRGVATNPSIERLLDQKKVVRAVDGASTTGYTIVVGPAGPIGPTGPGVTSSLAQTLAVGNTTGALDISVADGQGLIGVGAMEVSSGPTHDMSLSARGASTNLNQAGQTALHASYTGATRNSIIGALNAIVDGTIVLGGGGGGWTDDGTVVRLETVTDQVGIGTATPTANAKFELLGDATNRNIIITAGGIASGVAGSVTVTGGVSTDGGGGSLVFTGGAASVGAYSGGGVSVTGGAGGLTSGTGGALTFTAGAASAGNSAGGTAIVRGGAGVGSGTGGVGQLYGGAGGATGRGGDAGVFGANGGASGGEGGTVRVQSGEAGGSDAVTQNFDGGQIIITSGTGFGLGRGGSAQLTTDPGGARGRGGDLTLGTGAGGSLAASGAGRGGNISVTAGGAQGSNNNVGGSMFFTAGEGRGSSKGGDIYFYAGVASSGAGGDISLDGGDSTSGANGQVLLGTDNSYTSKVTICAATVVNLAFFAGAGTTKQTVSGSHGSNAALISLLTALASYGLITDSTSA